ncbi:hypothetical protein [Trichloromonas acetexigens]|uniref:Uncharacterized protein n=1 Tax=Trichloromonas acetexigens TaxID=38815 RepID=A0A550JD03_9BACT|nr:hypothetical protein [Desulfuromonas acetexigens]TRO81106.1 hypothetical protein FL622_09355 [Desulfuromonas acetexigens]
MTETVNSEILKNDNEVCADKGIPEIGKIISSMPKETLKSLLYLAAGKHDSNTKLFKRPIVINNNDISELNDLVQQKLTQHQTPVSLVNVAISYKANRSVSFGTWKEFEQYKWNIPDVVEHINIKWDFFVKWPTYAIPQRHTLSVKIVSKLNPMQMMQALFSKDPDEMEDIELNLAPVVCRVDFIDHLLSEELINIVKKWVEARREPDFITTRNSFLKKNKTSIARAIHHSIPVEGVI